MINSIVFSILFFVLAGVCADFGLAYTTAGFVVAGLISSGCVFWLCLESPLEKERRRAEKPK